MNDNDVVITSAVRTAVGSFGGSLSSLTAPQLGAEVIKKALEKSEIKPDQVEKDFLVNALNTCTNGGTPVSSNPTTSKPKP